MLGLVKDVFVEIINRPEVAQVPVKRGLVSQNACGNPRHHHVSAIARISRNRKAPGVRGGRGGRSLASGGVALRQSR